MLILEDTEKHKGKVIEKFENEYGNILVALNMEETIVIVFTDGSRITLSTDWRGSDCYISQRQNR